MEVRIKQGTEMLDATIEVVDGVMVVSPKVEKFEPKDGDVVTNVYEGIYQGTGIFNYDEDSEAWIYVCIDKEGSLQKDGYLGYVDDLRPATEEEKKKLFDKLKEEGYEWDAKKKEIIKVKWKPKEGETYWAAYFNNGATFKFDCYSGTYFSLASCGLDLDGIPCFKTKEECQEFCNRLNQAIEGVKP